MFNRTIIDKLKQWAKSPNRKPLILRGARQVGKTTAVNLFSKIYDQFISLNLEIKEEADLFNNELPISELVQSIYLYKNIANTKGKTLLFIDEIQNSPRAVMMLRYFYEKHPEIHVIAAGSLFEIMLDNKQISFPVGRVQFLYLYPLSFQEFLEANGETVALQTLNTIPLPEYAHSTLLKLYHTYTLIGGMPEVVEQYVTTKSIIALNPIYESLQTAYVDDISKYARTDKMREVLKYCIEISPIEAGKRIKFQGFGGSNYTNKDVSEALKTLERAMLLYLIYPSNSVEIPIAPQISKSPKLQLFDTGLLNFYAGLQKQYFKYDNLHAFYRGILAEHIVMQEIISLDLTTSHKPNFWTREKKQANSEVDLLLPFNEFLIPVEVKAGKSGTLRSLHQYIDRTSHEFAVRLYAGPLNIQRTTTIAGKNFYLLNLPYFLISKIYNYLEWMISDKNFR